MAEEGQAKGEDKATEGKLKKVVLSWGGWLVLFPLLLGFALFGVAYLGSVLHPERTLQFFGIQDQVNSYPTISNQGNIQLAAEASNVFEKLGPVGDFFGGLTNPVLSFITVIILLLSLRTQQQELADTRAELARTAKANEDLVSLQSKQVEISKNSADALLSAAEIQFKIAERQNKYNQRLDIISKLNYKIEILSYTVNRINSLESRINFITSSDSNWKFNHEKNHQVSKCIEFVNDLDYQRFNLERQIGELEVDLKSWDEVNADTSDIAQRPPRLHPDR